MNFQTLNAWPVLPANPGPWEFFWFHLPQAIPGFATALIGLLFFAAASYFAVRGGRFFSYGGAALTALGFGALGFLHALRTVLPGGELPAVLSGILYLFIFLIIPGMYYLGYYLTGERYGVFKWFAHFSLVPAVVGIPGFLSTTAFSLEYLDYLSLADVWLIPWGILSGLGYVFLGLPLFIRHVRATEIPPEKVKERRALHLGFHALIFAAIINLPAFLRMNLYPAAMFAFVPLLILAYGLFRADIGGLRRFLYTGNGLFYALNLLTAVALLSIALTATYGLSPSSYAGTAFPWVIFPLVSAVIVFSMGMLVGGTNPGQRLNQLASFSLYIIGFQLIAQAGHALGLDAFTARRIEQAALVVAAFSISVNMRLMHQAAAEKVPGYMLFLDMAAGVGAVFALTPFMHEGYHEYYFGDAGAAGPLYWFHVGLLGILMFRVGRVWWKARVDDGPEANPARMRSANVTALYILTTNGAVLLGIPAAIGLPVPSLLPLAFIPVLLLNRALFRHDGRLRHSHSLGISRRISRFVVFLAPLFLVVYFPSFAGRASVIHTIFHMILVASPVVLIVYQFVFLFSRPVSEQLDRTHARLEVERNEANRARGEIEKLNEISRKVNSVLDFEENLAHISEYIRANFPIEVVWFQLVDRDRNDLFTVRVDAPDDALEGQVDFALNCRIPLDPQGGIIYDVYLRKHPLYFSRRRENYRTGMDRLLAENFQHNSLLLMPLMAHNELIAMIILTNNSRPLKMTRQEFAQLKQFCDYITGFVHSAFLFREVERSRKLAVESRKYAEESRRLAEESTARSEKQKAELEKEILLAKKIQETLLPGRLPEMTGARLAFKYAPMLGVGGDFIDVLYEKDRELLGFFICDVSGHGVSAAFLAAMVKMSLHNWSETLERPVETLERVRAALSGKLAKHFISSCTGYIELRTGKVVLSNAGHPPLLWAQDNEIVGTVGPRGRVIWDNYLWNLNFQEQEFTLAPRDKIILYTDGIIEAQNTSDEMLGEAALIDLVHQFKYNTPDDFCRNVYQEVLRFTGDRPQLDDDFTLFVIEYTGPDEGQRENPPEARTG